MYVLSTTVKVKFNLMFLKEYQSPLIKAKQRQNTSAFVEEMTERKKKKTKQKTRFHGTQN